MTRVERFSVRFSFGRGGIDGDNESITEINDCEGRIVNDVECGEQIDSDGR